MTALPGVVAFSRTGQARLDSALSRSAPPASSPSSCSAPILVISELAWAFAVGVGPSGGTRRRRRGLRLSGLRLSAEVDLVGLVDQVCSALPMTREQAEQICTAVADRDHVAV